MPRGELFKVSFCRFWLDQTNFHDSWSPWHGRHDNMGDDYRKSPELHIHKMKVYDINHIMVTIINFWYGKVFFRYLTFKYFLWFMVFYYLSECISFEWVFGITLIYSKQSLSMYLLEYTRDESINTEILSNHILSK